MSNANDNNNKIVDLQQRQAAQAVHGGHYGELLRSMRGTATKRIQGLVNTLFENIDDALFDLAEKADNNAVQTLYFDGMRKVRLKRHTVERLFQDQLSNAFADFASGRLAPAKAEAPSRDAGDLTLLDDLELEESLAITTTIGKAENRLAPRLNALNRRLSTMRGGASVEDATNPIAPAHLCLAFRTATRELDLSVNSRLIIFKLFDRYVMSSLDSVYDEINQQLIRAGILPHIRYTMPPGSKRAPGSSPESMDAIGGMAEPPLPASMDASGLPIGMSSGYPDDFENATARLQFEIYNTVRSLLANRRSAMESSPGANYRSDLPSIAPTDLLSALTLLQNQATAAQPPSFAGLDASEMVQKIKHELINQASKLQGNKEARVAGVDEDTIDLVGMLFEFILQDRNLPPEMQVLLGRLQIPFLKVAILDKHLFAQKSHPARQLLDTMAQACVGWSEESDRDHRLYDKVKQTVDSVLKDFDDDLEIFDRTRAEFEAFLDTNLKRAELAEQRAAEATRGREKLHVSRRAAAREILKRVEDRNLPEIVHNVLTRPWANYLVLTLLRQGESSEEWQQALRFADDFAWSAEAKKTEADKTRLKNLLPGLEKQLRHGLATVAYHENDVKQLMRELNAFYRNPLGENMPALEDADGELVEGESKAAATAATLDSPVEEEIVLRAEAENSPAENYSDDDECLKLARGLKVGTWIEFTDSESGAKQRAKLSWISPISSKYLFVNRKGLKVSDKTVFALAAELRRGDATVLEEVPLFDRALDAIVERLKANHSSEVEDVQSGDAGTDPTPAIDE